MYQLYNVSKPAILMYIHNVHVVYIRLTEFDLSIHSQEDIIRFDVSMNYLMSV